MIAYDIERLPHPADRSGPCQGWCFGLPPGIATEQWPLDPRHGYPLKHGFTLLLPGDHRVHGPEFVASSFFAMAEEHDACSDAKDWPGIVGDTGPQPPSDPDRLPFWTSARNAHPRMSRMNDIISGCYAAILLTQAEFDGPFCVPPRWAGNALPDKETSPNWLVHGAGPDGYRDKIWSNEPFSWRAPPSLAAMSDNRGLRWTPRAHDPNAGIPPRDESDAQETGYQLPLRWVGDEEDGSYQEREWVKALALDHIGGTMQPVQAVPRFSPYYIGFEEELGGYNFGGGNAQLDFKDMKFDWACG